MTKLSDFIENELIWNNEYFDLHPCDCDDWCIKMARILLTKIYIGLKNRTIDPKFYYMAKIFCYGLLQDIEIVSGRTGKLITIKNEMIFVMISFLEFRTVNKMCDQNYFNNRQIYSAEEYFIKSRAIVGCDFESCIPLMHKIDSKTTKILEEYNTVQDILEIREVRIQNIKSARNV